ncbi:substance-P receptor-like [Stylophora pistillata]|uniref:substance-P receptor-like n=1 Tax=Stylophora pistillata TaxID=50429 RepID=UPI000C046A15|nr:substance-P receptor-like [Stylophora pistillata]
MDFHLIVLSYFGYGTIFLVSLFGNSCLIHIIRTDTSMRTAINYFILYQAFADLLISFTHLMETVRLNSYHGLWFGGNMGNITCKLYLASFYVFSAFSIYLLVTIAVDRFYAVFRPLENTPISRNMKRVILILWSCSFISSTAVVINGHLESSENSYFCHSMKLQNFNKVTELNVTSLTVGVVIPLTLLAVLYTRICIKLWSRQAPGEGASNNQRQLRVIAIARKVTRMMIAVFVSFLICWVPYYITMALFYLGFVQYKIREHGTSANIE